MHDPVREEREATLARVKKREERRKNNNSQDVAKFLRALDVRKVPFPES